MYEATGIDQTGIPSAACLCGCDMFKILVRFDDDGSIGWHTTNGYCFACHAKVTVPLPVDALVRSEEVEFVDDEG